MSGTQSPRENMRPTTDKCRRVKTRFPLTGIDADIETARTLFRQGKYLDAFDLYEQLADHYQAQAIPILAEGYDLFQLLPEKENRYHLYQARYFDFSIQPSDKVLDIGSGHLPFPLATHLADLTLADGAVGRAGEAFRYQDGKPVYECGVEEMPFADKEFDFVYCSHVLEHAQDPEKACRELMRVGKRGYIETPTRGKDLWLNTAEISNHRWAVEWINDSLIFTKYTPKEVEGLRCNILMDMHCFPKTERERAFSALICLKADLMNTMVYWEDTVNFEVRRQPQPFTLHTEIETAPSSSPEMKVVKPSCLFLNTYYGAFLHNFYSRNPHLASSSYRQQMNALQGDCFGDSDFYSEGLKKTGWAAEDLIINCHYLQQAWARENGFAGEGYQVALEQIRQTHPQVVYFQDLSVGTKEFIEAVRPYTDLIVGQIASPVPEEAYLSGFDIIFSSFPHFVERFRQAGITSYYQPLAFEPRVLDKIGVQHRKYPATFVGGISAAHGKGVQLLERIAGLASVEFWGYGADSLPQGSVIRERHHGEAWGNGMFSLLGQSRITINRHIDVAENNANNMRLFEATGCGALLITDYKDNLNELFEIGKEIAAYRSPEECAALIAYHEAHPGEAEAMARAGQARTLSDHTYEKRMQQTSEILERHIRYRREAKTLIPPDLSRISYGYTQINPNAVTEKLTSAWQNAEIPSHQRSLVQTELANIYSGKIALPFRILADLLKPVAISGSQVLEIGCASGYYYEALEYLLSIRLNYTGADYSEAMIAMARDYYPRASFEVADGARLPFPDRAFHLVISGGILLHTPDYARHIKETARVADKYIAAHRTPVCRNRPTSFFTKLAYEVETVEIRFNEKEFIELFEKQGFRLTKQIQYSEDTLQDEYEVSYLFTRDGRQSDTTAPFQTATSTNRNKPQHPARPRNSGPVVLVSRAIAFTFPLSYAYLAGYLRSRGEDVTVLFKDIPAEALVRKIMDLNPLIVGFGNLYPELEEIRGLIRMLDKAGRTFPIVIGGQMVSPIPEFAVQITGADYGIMGEGEIILYELVRKLREGKDPSDLSGLVVRNGADVRNNGPGDYISDLSLLPPLPYDLFPVEQWLPIGEWYARNLPTPHWKVEDRVINVHGGRGCPFTCNFCYHHGKARYRDISLMMSEAQEALIRFNGNMLYFSDDLVLAEPKRARRLIDAIGGLDRPISYQVSTRFDILARMDDSLLQDLKRTGCRSMGLGLESGSDRILKIIGKNCTSTQILEGLERLRQVGIYPTTTIMIGQHTETVDDVLASMRLMLAAVRSNPFIEFAFTLTTPFPGSPLHSMIFEKGYLKSEQEFYDRYFSSPGDWKQVVNLSAMTDNEIRYLFHEMQRVYTEEKIKSRDKLGIIASTRQGERWNTYMANA